jgi:hypothetical protein
MNDLITRSVGLVAVLKMHGFGPVTTRAGEGGKTMFVYERTAAINALVNAYFDGSLKVSARDYNFAVIDIRNALAGM